MRKRLTLLLFIITSACSPFEYAPPPATPETVTVAYPPTLTWIVPFLHDCAQQTPGLILRVEERVSPDFQVADMFLSLGAPPEGIPSYATLLGHESLVVIANPAIDPATLDVSAMRKSYASLEPPYQAWSYPQEYLIRQIFKAALLGEDYTPRVLLAPDPEAMLQAVQNHDNAIGFVPESSLNDHVQVVPLPNDIQAKLNLPLITLTRDEPEGAMKLFLACMSE